MESNHAIATPAQVETARMIFQAYADTCLGNSATPTHMGVLAVLQYLGTIGVKKTENEVKDFILAITQSGTKQEPQIEQPPTIIGIPQARRSSTPTSTGKSKRRSSSKTSIPVQIQMTPVQPPLDTTSTSSLLLGFEDFLSLTLFTFDESAGGDCEKHKELKSTFSEMDADKDGIISANDLRLLISKHFINPYTKGKSFVTNPYNELSKLTPAQIHSILVELDVGNDGVASYEDYISAIETA